MLLLQQVFEQPLGRCRCRLTLRDQVRLPLSFCYSQLAQPKNRLCIFGHSLAAQDQHLIQALQQAG